MTTTVIQFPTAPPPERARIATAIRAHLAVHNLSDTKAGELIGLSQSAMSRRTNAQHPFDIDELGKLAGALGLTIHQLIVMPKLPDLDSNQEPIAFKPAPDQGLSQLDEHRRAKEAAHHEIQRVRGTRAG